MDAKLQQLMKQGTQAEARARLEQLLKKRDGLATDNYVRYCIAEGKRNGFNLLQGDVALIHPRDLPPTVKLLEGRDPVYACAHPLVLEGKMLFVRKKLAHKYLDAQLASQAHRAVKH